MDEPLTAAEYEHWSAVRAKGLWRFLLVDGILVRGLLFSLSSTLFIQVVKGKPPNWEELPLDLALQAITFGTIAAGWEWRSYQKSYALGAPAPPDQAKTECLACGGEISAGEDRCPACGWTYEEEDQQRATNP